MEKHNDDKFTFYSIGIVMLIMSAVFLGAILGGKPLNAVSLLVPTVFGSVGLIFIVGTYRWSRKI